MKKYILIILIGVLLSCIIFSADSKSKSISIPVNITILNATPQSNMNIVNIKPVVGYMNDPDNEIFSNLPITIPENWDGSIISTSAIIKANANYKANICFSYDHFWNDFEGDFDLKFYVYDYDIENEKRGMFLSSWNFRRDFFLKRTPSCRALTSSIYHGIGIKYYEIQFFIQSADKNWEEIQEFVEKAIGEIIINFQ